MATSVQFAGMAGGGGFVLKSIREGILGTQPTQTQTFSVQNEGDFCIISRDFAGTNYKFNISQIDDIPVNIATGASDIVFGKNIVVKAEGYDFNYHIYEYGPAE
jgi:hypothetical protein